MKRRQPVRGILFYFWWDNLTGLASSRRGIRGIPVHSRLARLYKRVVVFYADNRNRANTRKYKAIRRHCVTAARRDFFWRVTNSGVPKQKAAA